MIHAEMNIACRNIDFRLQDVFTFRFMATHSRTRLVHIHDIIDLHNTINIIDLHNTINIIGLHNTIYMYILDKSRTYDI